MRLCGKISREKLLSLVLLSVKLFPKLNIQIVEDALKFELLLSFTNICHKFQTGTIYFLLDNDIRHSFKTSHET